MTSPDEVQKLDLAVRIDEHVGRFDVPMHDQVGMRMSNGREHVEEQTQARLDVEVLAVAVTVDLLALDVLEHEIGLTRRRYARVDQTRNVRMCKAGQNAALAPEALFPGTADEAGVQELQCRLPLEAPVAAPGEPDIAHAPLADQ